MLLMLAQSALAGAATLKTCPDTALALPDGLEDVKRRVVRIEVTKGAGSGTIVSPDGFVLTAAHVVGRAEKVKVVLSDESSYDGEVVATDADADVALVRFDATKLPCLPLAKERASTGSDLFLMGSPSGKVFTHSVTKGIVSGYRENEGVEVLQTDASLSPGYSGGPVLGLDGTVQGVISFKVVGEAIEGIGFATTSSQATEALDITFGEMTEIDREALPDSTEKTDRKFTGTIEIRERPDHIAPALASPPCHRLDFASKKDPFDDTRVIQGRGRDLFAYKVPEQGAATLTMFAPVSLFWEDQGVQQPRTDLKLLDGTEITLTAKTMPEMVLSSILTPTVAVDFELTKELAAALASSGPTVQRWTYGKTVIDLDRSERQRVKYFRPHFSCLLQAWD